MEHDLIKMNLALVRERFKERSGESLNIRELADRFGISHTMLYNWKKGEGTERLDTINRIMELTGLKFNEIFTKDELAKN